jgi:quercetin dioxygenase-like cupin family protein
MEVRRGAEAAATEVVPDVHNTKLAEGERMNVLQFEIGPGGSVPRHDHPHEQVGYVVAGRPTFVTDDGETTLEPGDSYAIPGGEPHALENRTDEPVVGVDVFSPPREFAPFAED